MDTLIIRDESWNWCYYLVFAILIFACLLFSFNAVKGFFYFIDRKKVANYVSEEVRPRVIGFSTFFNLALWIALTAMALFLIVIAYRDVFGGFLRVEIFDEKVKLLYMWPFKGGELTRNEIKQVEIEPYGRKSSVLEIVTVDGTKLKSVSNDTDEIRSSSADLARMLKMGH